MWRAGYWDSWSDRDVAAVVGGLREEIHRAPRLRAEEELPAIGRPDREDVDPRVEGRARERCAGQIPQPDVYLLIGDVKREARAVRREPWKGIVTRRCGYRCLLALPVHPHQAPRICRMPSTRDVDQRPIGRHCHTRIPPPQPHLGLHRHWHADDSEPGEVEGDGVQHPRRGVDQMPARHVACIAAASNQHGLRAGPEIEDGDLRLSPPPLVAVIVNSTAWPPGRISGQKWSRSPPARFGRVSTVGSPPATVICCRPVVGSLVAKMIEPSGPQLAPRAVPSERPSVTAGPPVIATFFSAKSLEEADPLAVRRDERPIRHAEPGERRGVELIEGAHEECRAVGADIDDARAIRREGHAVSVPATTDIAAALGGVMRRRDTRGGAVERASRTRPRCRPSPRRRATCRTVSPCGATAVVVERSSRNCLAQWLAQHPGGRRGRICATAISAMRCRAGLSRDIG